MPSMHILIYEPSKGGHQMVYIRYILDSIVINVANPRVTMLMTPAAAEHPNARQVLKDFAGLVTLRLTPDVSESNYLFRKVDPFYDYQWRNVEAFARAFSEIGPESVDFVLLPYLETIGLLHLGLRPRLFAGKPWATISISIRFHYHKVGISADRNASDLLQALFFRRVLGDPSLTCFGTIDPYLEPAIKSPKIKYCAAPGTPPESTTMSDARAAYGLRPETVVIVVFGIIDRRKCIDVLLEGAARVVPDLDLTVLLAGPQNPEHVGAALNSQAADTLRNHGRLVEANRYIIAGRDPEPISAADITWVFYERKFVASSSVMVQSALYQRPVIVRDWGVLGHQVRELECGIAIPSGSPDEVAAALTRLARDPSLRTEMGRKGAAAFAESTPENFALPIINAIRASRPTRPCDQMSAQPGTLR